MRYNKRIVCVDNPVANNLAIGCGAKILKKEEVDLKNLKKQIIIRGNLSTSFLKDVLLYKKNFYYIDTGYLDLFTKYKKKNWHRIIKNNFHMDKVIERPSDRFDNLRLSRFPWKKNGRNIIICPISDWTSSIYNIDPDIWLKNTINTIKKHSDRPIIIRKKPKKRSDRMFEKSLYKALDDDVFCLVTYNSIAAVESIYYGIPAFALGENAACPVSSRDLSKIEYPVYPDREMWLRNIAYSQFTCEEMRNGTAINILKNTPWGSHEV